MSKQPCNNCPFRTDVQMCLNPKRVESIVDALYHDGDFPCHKTVDYGNSSEGEVNQNSRRCIGAALFLEKTTPGGLRANVIFRFALLMKEFKLKELDRTVEVWGSLEEFIEGQL